MTETQALLDKPARSFDAAQRLLADGDADFAASRAYYGCFDVAEALLRSDGLTYSRHGQVLGQLGARFVKAGRLDAAHHQTLHRAFSLRQTADYSVVSEVDVAAVEQLIADGRRFLDAARTVLG